MTDPDRKNTDCVLDSFFVIKSRMVLFNTWQCLEISIAFAKKHKYLLIEGGTFRDIINTVEPRRFNFKGKRNIVRNADCK